MAHKRPWYQRNGSAMVIGTLHMPSAEHKWAYSAIIDMLNDRERPLPDDAGFICGFTGLSKRRWREVREFLLNDQDAQGETRLFIDEHGDLSNPRFARELAARLDGKAKAAEYGREGGLKSAAIRQGNLGLGDETDPKSPEKGAHKVEKNPAIKSTLSGEKSEINGAEHAKINGLAQDPPQATRVREPASEAKRPREEEESSPTTLPRTPANADDADDDSRWDLLGITNRIARAGAVSLHRETTRVAAMDLVKGWLQQGIDVEATIIPTVERCLTDTHETSIGSLAFYASAVLKAHNQSKRKPKTRTDATPDPIFEFVDEDRRFVDLRKELFGALGGWAYARFAHQARFSSDRRRNGKLALVVKQVGSAQYAASRLLDGERISIVTRIAKHHGFDEAW